MWLAFPVLLLVVLLLAGGLVVGGIYAAVLVPIAAIILAGAVIHTMWEKANAGHTLPDDREHSDLPHTPAQSMPSPTTPDQLVDAERSAQ